MAQKKITFNEWNKILMVPSCHPDKHMVVYYKPERGGDTILINCEQCGNRYFTIKLPKEDS